MRPTRRRGHEPHAECGGGHEEERQQEHLSPPVAVAEMAEDDPTDGPREIADGKRRERRDQRDKRRGIREDRVRDVLGEYAEDHEIVELERAAETGQQDDSPAGLGRCGRLSRAHYRSGTSTTLIDTGHRDTRGELRIGAL